MLVMLLADTAVASTITVGNDGTDLVQTNNFCQLSVPYGGLTNACDYNYGSTGDASSNPSSIYDRTLFVRWSSTKLIRSVRLLTSSYLSFQCHVDLYVTTSKTSITLNDVRTICQLNVWSYGDGIWNCPSSLKGTYLALIPKPECNIYYWGIAEIRAWSRKDIANSAIITWGGVSGSHLLGPTIDGTYNERYYNTSPAVINLGSQMELETVWISHYSKTGNTFAVSTGTTAPNTSQAPTALNNVAAKTLMVFNEEWYFNQTPVSTQYILIYSNSWQMDLRKIAAFGVDYCTPATSVTTSLVTAYSSIVYYFGTSITIPWPSYSITPGDCFIPVNFIFKDSAGTLLATGIVTVNWVAKTITYLSLSCHSPYITIQAEFNTLNAALGGVDQIPFTCPCVTATITAQTFAVPTPFQINLPVSSPVSILSFMMNADSAGQAASDPMKCGLKTYSTGFSWLTVLSPANPLTQNFQLQVNTNDYTLSENYSVNIVVAFVNASYTATLTQTLSVILLHPCKTTIISFSFTSLPAMTNTITYISVSQSFVLATDSVTITSGIASFCGPIEYSIVEAYSFLTVTAGTLSLGSNLMIDSGMHTATLQAKLTDYAGATPAQVAFSATLVSVCSLTNTFTVASLPETIFICSTHNYTVLNSLDPACIQSVSVIEQSTAVLPIFMSFDSDSNTLTVTPGPTDFGTFNLDFTVITIPAPTSQSSTVSYVLTVQKVDLLTTPPTESIAYIIQGSPIKIPFPVYNLPTGSGILTYKLILQEKTSVFKENKVFNSPVITDQLPQLITLDSDFITIAGDTFSEGWNSYKFQVLASLQSNVVNDEFLFSVDTMIQCSDAKIIPQFNQTVYYLVYSPANIQKIVFSDTKSDQTGIQDSCGPIRFQMTAIENNIIKPLPSFVKLNKDEMKVKCEDDSQVGSYILLVDSYFETIPTAKHSYYEILLNLFSAQFSVPLQEPTSSIKEPINNQTNIELPVEINITKFEVKKTSKVVQQIQMYATFLIDKISSFGLVTIKFSQDVLTTLVPQKLQDIITFEFLQVTYIQNSIEQPIHMSFNITNFTSNYIEVQLEFDQPLLVSANINQQDEIKIKLSSFFLIPTKSLLLAGLQNEYVELKSNLPKMVSSQAELAQLESLSKSAKKASVVFVLLPSFAQFFAKGIMKRLWAFFHAMQLIESYSEMSMVGLSLNAQMLQDGYHDIINAKLLPDSVIEKIRQVFNSTDTEDTNTSDSTNTTDQGSRRRLISNQNLKRGIIAGAGSLIGISMFMIVCLIVFWRRVPKIIKDQIVTLKQMVFFNGPIRAVFELFYPTICLSLMNLMNNEGTRLTGFKIALFAGFVPFSLNFVIKNEPLIEDKNFHLKYGAFFTNVERFQKPKAIYYPFVFLVHRLLMAVIITCMGFSLVLQVLLLTHINLLMLCWLVLVWPMDTPFKNWLEVINGFLVLVMGYFSFLFSDYVPDPRTQYKIGYVYIALILFFFAFNLTFQVFLVVREFYLSRKSKKIAAEQKEEARLEAGKKDPKFLTMRERLQLLMEQSLKQDQDGKNESNDSNESNVSNRQSKNQIRRIVAKNKKQQLSIKKNSNRANLKDYRVPAPANPQQDQPTVLLQPEVFEKQQRQAKEADEKKKWSDPHLFDVNPDSSRLKLPAKSGSPFKTVQKVQVGEESTQNLQIEEDFTENQITVPKSYNQCLRDLQKLDEQQREENPFRYHQQTSVDMLPTSSNSPKMSRPLKNKQGPQIDEKTKEEMKRTDYGFAYLNTKQYAWQLKEDKRHEEYMMEQNIKIFHLQPNNEKKAYQIEEEESKQPKPKKKKQDSWSDMSIHVSDHEKDVSSRSEQHDWGNEKDNNEIFNDLVKELGLNKVPRF